MPESRLVAESPAAVSESGEAAGEKNMRGAAKQRVAAFWEAEKERTGANPYVGPRAARTGEPIFGRDNELLDLRDLLIAERIVLLYSPWGAGKTSLIQAGLIPAMVQDDFLVLPIIRISNSPTTPIGNRYVTSAIVSLEKQLSGFATPLPAIEWAEFSLSDYFEKRRDLLGFDSTLLIFDQFEEILTTDPFDYEGKAEFFRQVGSLLRHTGRWALFAIREDYVAGLDPYARAVPTRLKSTFRLDLLTPAGARDAIEKPALTRNVIFAPEATAQLVADLRSVMVRSGDGKWGKRLGPSIEPVHLQVVCYKLWEKPRLKPSEIGGKEISAIGDVDSALGDYYAEQIGNIVRDTGVREKLLREWFDRCLITESGVRTEVMWNTDETAGLSEETVVRLEKAHLIRREERRDATWLELSHTRLATAIRTNNIRWFAQHLSLLQQQAVLWKQQDRNEALCLDGEALAKAKGWATEHPDELTDTDEQFLKASTNKENLRLAKLLKERIVALSGVVIVLAALAIFALLQWQEAVKQEGIAETQARIAKKQADIASARGLASIAYRLLDERLDIATLLAFEAWRRVDLPETRNTLLAAALYNPRLVSFLHGQQSPIGALAFSPDGKFIAAGDYSSRIVLWNVETHQPKPLPKFFDDAVRAIAFSANGEYMAASSKRREKNKPARIVLRNLRTNEQTMLSDGTGDPDNAWSVTFSPDSALLASADSDGRVIIWPVPSGAPIQLSGEAKGQARSVAFSKSGSFLAAGYYKDGKVVVWQRKEQDWILYDTFSVPAPVLAGTGPERPLESSRITCVAFSPTDDNLLAFGSEDWSVNVRDLGERRTVGKGKHAGGVRSVAFAPDGKVLGSGAEDGMLRLWRVPKRLGAPQSIDFSGAATNAAPLELIGRPLAGHTSHVLAIAFSPDGRFLASGGIDREAILWDAQQTSVEDPKTNEASPEASALALSLDGRFVIAGYSDGHVVCRNRSNSEETITPATDRPVKSIGFSRDGSFMISASSNDSGGQITVSKVGSLGGEPIPITFDGRKTKITFAALSPNGKRAAISTSNGEILVWDVDKREQIGVLNGLEDNLVYTITFSPDGKRLAAGGTNECAIIWDIDSHKRTKQKWEHNGDVLVAAFSQDGAILATASRDHTVLLSDSVTGDPLGPPLTGHRGAVVALAFRSDGKMLASGGEDRSVILWDIDTRQQVGPRLLKHVASVRALHFEANGKQLVSASSAWDPIEWDLDFDTLPARSQARTNRNLTDPEWNAYMKPNMNGMPNRKTWPNLRGGEENVSSTQEKKE